MQTQPSAMVERVARAIDADTGIWMRTNKGERLPFEIIDRSGEPILLSAWGSLEEAKAACARTDLLRRAEAAIAAMREPTEAMIYIGEGVEFRGEIWREMIDAALGA
jgi:hypothetical protein